MKQILLPALLLLGLFLTQAQASSELAAGQLYQGGTELTVSPLGLDLTVPVGWHALLPPATDALIFEAPDQSARLLVSGVPEQSAQAVESIMRESSELDVGVMIHPKAKPELNNGVYTQSFEVSGVNSQGVKVSGAARLGDNRVAVYVVIIASSAEALERAESTALILLQGMRFSPLQAASSSQAGNETIDWQQVLRGRTLNYLKTSNGLSINKKLNLCSNGTVIYSDRDSYVSSSAMSNFSANTGRGDVGRWSINGNRLSINWDDGSRSSRVLSRRYVQQWNEWGTFLDDERWFNVANEVCQ